MAASHTHCPCRVEKSALRAAMLERRAGADPIAAGMALAERFPARLPAGIVAGFWPLPGEIDIRALLTVLAERHAVCLPVTPRRGEALCFRLWRPGAPLAAGRFGTSHPTGATAVPDYLLVPLLAFDAGGNRLGYGGGFYDRTLAALPGAVAIGCAFAALQVEAVPHEAGDIRLDAVATECGIIDCI